MIQRIPPPTLIEMRLSRDLRQAMGAFSGALASVLNSAPALLAGAPPGYDATIERLMVRVRHALAAVMPEHWVRSTVEKAALAVDDHNVRTLERHAENVLGRRVAMRAGRALDLLADVARSYTKAVMAIPEAIASKLESVLRRLVRGGADTEALSAGLRPFFGATRADADDEPTRAERNAERIARNAVHQTHALLTELRMSALGVTHYTWRTELDERVRPSHAAREGKRFAWTDPPKSDGPYDGNPGEPPNCRCIAEPILDESVEAPAPKAQPALPSLFAAPPRAPQPPAFFAAPPGQPQRPAVPALFAAPPQPRPALFAAQAGAPQPTALAHAEPKARRKLGGGVTITELLTFDAPEGPVQGVWKPAKKPANSKGGIAQGVERMRNEVATFELDKLLGGQTVVPETVVRTDPQQGKGSIQSFTPTEGTIESWAINQREPALDALAQHETTRRTWLLDVITGNPDRHAQNLLVTGGKAVAIDNGEAFPPTWAGYFQFPLSVSGKIPLALDPQQRGLIERLDLGAMAAVLAKAEIEEPAIVAALARVRALQLDSRSIDKTVRPTNIQKGNGILDESTVAIGNWQEASFSDRKKLLGAEEARRVEAIAAKALDDAEFERGE